MEGPLKRSPAETLTNRSASHSRGNPEEIEKTPQSTSKNPGWEPQFYVMTGS